MTKKEESQSQLRQNSTVTIGGGEGKKHHCNPFYSNVWTRVVGSDDDNHAGSNSCSTNAVHCVLSFKYLSNNNNDAAEEEKPWHREA